MVRSILRSDDRWSRWLSAEVRASLAAEFIQDLPQLRRRSRASIAGTIAVRACDEKPADFVHAPCDVAHSAAMAVDWMRGVSDDLIVWLRDVCDQLDELEDRQRAQHDRQGAMTGSPHYARCLFRH